MKFSALIKAAMSSRSPNQSGDSLAEAERKYSRLRFILARRRLSPELRGRFDELVLALLRPSITAWSGYLTTDYDDLATLIADGWVKK